MYFMYLSYGLYAYVFPRENINIEEKNEQPAAVHA